METTERKGTAAVSWLKNDKQQKPYEDRYRLLTRDIPLVGKAGRGELFAVLDGIGGAPRGMQAAQAIADCLVDFYRKPGEIPAESIGLMRLLQRTNQEINGWGCTAGTDRPLGGAVGTIAWVREGTLTIFHAGDTTGMLLRPDKESKLLTSLHEYDGGISRYFGLGRRLEIEVITEPVEEGDLVLLMSDGVTKVFSPMEAAGLVHEVWDRTGDVAAAARELTVRSRNRRSADDITVMVIEVCDD